LSNQPQLNLSLTSNSNTLPLAAYLDPDEWNVLVRLKKPNISSYHLRCKNTSSTAAGLFSQIGTGYCYGEEADPGKWTTFNAGSPGWTHRWQGNSRVGVITGVFRPLESKDILRAFCGPRSAIAVSDRFNENHLNWIKNPPVNDSPCLMKTINSIRFDIDLAGGWSTFPAIRLCNQASMAGDVSGFQNRSFFTGNRGIQTIFALPAPVTIRTATALASLLRNILQQHVGTDGIVDADSTSSLMRLPGCRHAKSQKLGLFIDSGNRCFFDAKEQARLISRSFGWNESELGSYLSVHDFSELVNHIEALLDAHNLQHDLRVRGQQLATILTSDTKPGKYNLIDDARSNLAVQVAGGFTQATSTSVQQSNAATIRKELAQKHLLNHPVSGATWQWMTYSFGGVWSCRLLHGEQLGLDVLLDILRNVPAKSKSVLAQREKTAKRLWSTFRFLPPSATIPAFHSADMVGVGVIVELALKAGRTYNHKAGDIKTTMDIRQLQNLVKVANVMLHALRESGGVEFTLSERNGSHLSKKFFDKAVSPSTFKRISRMLEAEQRVRYERTMPYSVQGGIEWEGEVPIASVFEKQPGTTNRYRPSKWLTNLLREHEQLT
jgi:hypothetical protein